MPLQATSGAASYDGFGGGVAAVPQYIEDVFSTYLYTGTGTGATQTITNGIDLSTKGGLVWAKSRTTAGDNHILVDTARGVNTTLSTDNTGAQITSFPTVSSFLTTGFTATNFINNIGNNLASWTFRKQPKFFDVVTYTGNGTAGRQIAHGLGSTPGFLVVKRTDSTSNWSTWHTSIPNAYMSLDTTNPQNTDNGVLWGNGSTHIDPTSTVFTVSSNAQVNASGGTYVAYLFAHNAGGFGLTGTDNVISCGSFSLDSAVGVDVNLGYEAQWVLIKRTDSSAGSSGWYLLDTMRGWTVDATFGDNYLVANTSAAEAGQSIGRPTATGFAIQASTWLSTGSYIYIAIRRGPMKVPTTGTSVFSPALYTGTGSNNTITSPFPSDLLIVPNRAGQYFSPSFWDRLRGATKFLRSTGTDAEAVSSDGLTSFGEGQNSVAVGADATYGNINFSGRNYVPYSFRRAPGFFDEVCYQGNGVAGRSISHNLGVAPELMIVKGRSSSSTSWVVGSNAIGVNNNVFLQYNGASANYGATFFYNTNPTSSVFYVGSDLSVNASVPTYVAYLFASCAGVSKCGTFTGNGSSQTINCGFTGGARFVMIKATSTTGDWMVADSARGIVSGSDPYLELNNTNAEVTGEDWLDTDSTGFVVNQVSASNANTNGVTYIYLAIA